MANRLIAIGDIHGELLRLNNLLEKLELQDGDELVFLGDYIDRGVYSKQVVERLIELFKTYKCHFLMGNHEYYMINAAKGDKNAMYFFMNFGGVQTLESYGGSLEDIMKTHGEFYNSLKYYHITPDYFFIHAGLNPQKPLDKQEAPDDILLIRDEFIKHKHNLKQKVVFGHTPFETPLVKPDKIGIDTGCGKYDDAHITALICGEEKFIQSDLMYQ